MIRQSSMIAAAAFALALSAPAANATSLADALSNGLRGQPAAEATQPAPATTSTPARAESGDTAGTETDGSKPWVCRVHYNHAHCRYYRPRYYYTYTYVTRYRYVYW